MGRIVKYGHDGTQMVVKDGANKADLARMAKRAEARDWDVSWLSPVEFEITRDAEAAGAVFVLRPANWPCHDGEPV